MSRLNNKFQAMMDREKKDELPQMQVEFIDVICLPLYKVSTPSLEVCRSVKLAISAFSIYLNIFCEI